MVLTKMKDAAAAYMGAQHQAMQFSGSISRLNVLRIIEELTAAAIGCGLEGVNGSAGFGGTEQGSQARACDPFFESIHAATQITTYLFFYYFVRIRWDQISLNKWHVGRTCLAGDDASASF